jgi:hypothetical protein
MTIPDGIIPDGADDGWILQEAMRELESAIHDARVAFDCIGLGEIDRAHTSAVTSRVAIDAAVTAVQTVLTGAVHDAGPPTSLSRSTEPGNGGPRASLLELI